MRQRFAIVIGLVVSIVNPASVAAQQTAGTPADGPVSFGLVGGFSAGGGDKSAVIGGVFAVDLTRTFALEARGVHVDRGVGSDALEVSASLIVSLLDGRRVSPYLAFGGGIYRASFDLDHQRFFGTMRPFAGAQVVPIPGGSHWGVTYGPGMMSGWPNTDAWGPGWMMGNFRWNGTTWAGPTFDISQMPMFYGGRIGPMTVPANGHWGRRAFTDPAVSLGGGVRLGISEHVFVTPDARALLVIGGGDTYTIGSVSVGVGYRF